MLETKGSLDLAKQKLIYIAELIGKPRKEHLSVSSSAPPYEPTNSRGNLYKAELKKSQALMHWQILNRLV